MVSHAPAGKLRRPRGRARIWSVLLSTACLLAWGGRVRADEPSSDRAEARGDAAFAARASGMTREGVVDPVNISRAIEAYEAALAAAP